MNVTDIVIYKAPCPSGQHEARWTGMHNDNHTSTVRVECSCPSVSNPSCVLPTDVDKSPAPPPAPLSWMGF